MAAVLLIAFGCDRGGAATGALPAAEPPEPPAAALAATPLGEPSPLVSESTETPDRSSPEALLRSILAGRERVDLAFLARCESATANKEFIDKVDEARAWRNYCMGSVEPLWLKIEGALDGGRASFTAEGDRGTGLFDVGGAIGEMDLRFTRIDGQWYIEIGE